MNRIMTTTLAGLALTAIPATLIAGEVDVLPRIENNQLVTYAFDKGEGVNEGLSRVFGAELGEFPFPPGKTEEPGFYTDSTAGNLPAGAGIGFRILGGLRVWNDSLSNFDALASITMELETAGGAEIRTTPADFSTIVDGPIFGVTSGSLFFDAHPDYIISDPAQTGVYLLTISVWTDLPGVIDSAPLFFVFNNGADEATHQAAIAYAQNVLVPAPGAAVLLAAALPFAIRRRR